MGEDNASHPVEHEVATELGQIAVGPARPAPPNDVPRVKADRVPAEDVPHAAPPEAKGRVGSTRRIAQNRVRDGLGRGKPRNLVRRLERHDHDFSGQPIDLLLMLAQLREVRPARQSTEPSQEDQNYRAASPLAQRDRSAAAIEQFDLRCQRVFHDRPQPVLLIIVADRLLMCSGTLTSVVLLVISITVWPAKGLLGYQRTTIGSLDRGEPHPLRECARPGQSFGRESGCDVRSAVDFPGEDQ